MPRGASISSQERGLRKERNVFHHSARRATAFLDADAPEVVRFAARHAGSGDDRQRAVRLYYAVRDSIRYDMTTFGLDPVQFNASKCLDADSTFCVPKAIAFAAAARSTRIPARLGFADVRNHLVSPRMAALIDDDVFRWHAYTSLMVDGRWDDRRKHPHVSYGTAKREGERGSAQAAR
jgi:transglutaminase-like putative cysteine protease